MLQLIPDDGEVFRVKKSSQSRRLMKQKKAEKKRNKFGQIDEDLNEDGGDQNGDQIEKSQDPKVQVIPFQDLEIKVRDNITRKEAPSRYQSPVSFSLWTESHIFHILLKTLLVLYSRGSNTEQVRYSDAP